jgi:RNA-binding protein
MFELDVAQRRLLAASAHHLNPVVMIGKDGLTAGVIGELDRCLLKHELIKVKILDEDRDRRTSLLEQICQSLHAAPVRQIGKILIIYRPKPDEKDQTTATSVKPRPKSKLKPKPKSGPHRKKSALTRRRGP